MNILNYIFYGEKLIENSKIEIKFSKDDRNNVKIKYSCQCKKNQVVSITNFITLFKHKIIYELNNVEDMKGMFYKLSSLKSYFDTNNVKDMSFMFCDCSSLTFLNLSIVILINLKT